MQKALMACVLLVLMGCGSAPASKKPQQHSAGTWQFKTQLTDVRWGLVSMDGKSIDTVDAPNIYFDASLNNANGNTGCNVYNGRYSAAAGQLTIGKLLTTRMACTDSKRMELEREFKSMLAQTQRYVISNQQLQLLGSSGNVLMVLEQY